MLPTYLKNTFRFQLNILFVTVVICSCFIHEEAQAQRLATEFRDIRVLPNLDTLVRYRRGGDWWFGGMVGGIGGLYFGNINVNRLAPDENRGIVSISSGDGNGYFTGLLAEYAPIGSKLGGAVRVAVFDKRIGSGLSEVISGISINNREVDSLHRYSTITTNNYISISPEIRYDLNQKGLHLLGGFDAEILASARASTIREFDNIGHIIEQRTDPSYSASPFRFGAHIGIGLDIVSATLSSGIRFRFSPYVTLNSGTVTTTNLGSSWNTVFARFGVAVKFGFDDITDTIRKYDSSFVEPPHYLATIMWEKGISVPSYRTAERLAVADLAYSAIEAPPVDITKETIDPSDDTKSATPDVKIPETDAKTPDVKIAETVVTTPTQDIKISADVKPPVVDANKPTQEIIPQQSVAVLTPDEVRPSTSVISTNEGVKPNATEKKAPKISVGDKKTFLFSTTKSINLSPDSKEYYDALANYLKLNPRAVVYIVGHTDNQGTAEELQKISDDRALQVRGYFERKGIPRRRLFPSGKSSTEPIRTNTTEAGRKENRRVEITISNGR